MLWNCLTSAYNSYRARLIHTSFSGRHFKCVHDAALNMADGNTGKLMSRLEAIRLSFSLATLVSAGMSTLYSGYCKAHIGGQRSAVLITFD